MTTNSTFATERYEKAVNEMKDLISVELNNLNDGLHSEKFFETGASNSPLSFSGFEILLNSNVGVEVPFLAGLEIFVEMELVWAKSE